MKKLRNIQFILSSKLKIPSVNNSYAAMTKKVNGKTVATVYKTASAKNWQRQILDQLDMIDFETEAPWIFDKSRMFTLSFRFIINSGLGRSDTDNRIKICQDSLFKRLHLNDSRVLKVEADKVLLPGAKEERICVSLTENLTDPLFNNLEPIPCPENIFIQGKLNSVLDSWLTERRYDFTYEDKDDYKTTKMDCLLSFIYPDTTTSLTQVAEVLEEIRYIKEYGYGSVFLGVVGVASDYQPEVYKELLRCIALVNTISGGSKHIAAAPVSEPLDASILFLDGNGWKGKRKKKI